MPSLKVLSRSSPLGFAIFFDILSIDSQGIKKYHKNLDTTPHPPVEKLFFFCFFFLLLKNGYEITVLNAILTQIKDLKSKQVQRLA